MLKIATWNVNSVKVRLPHVLDWLRTAAPDVLLLQEIKTPDESFPRLELRSAGYDSLIRGQKGYNGVAILSRLPLVETARVLPGAADDLEARYIEARLEGDVRVASLYLPNGNPVDGEKFPYKLSWMARLRDHAKTLLHRGETVVLGGDYNVCPTDDDVYAPEQWTDNALCRREVREAFRSLLWLGYTDAFRAFTHAPGAYTFWDYQAGAWQRNLGLRIDHLLLSPQAADRLEACAIDTEPRGRDKPSDHTPIWCTLRE